MPNYTALPLRDKRRVLACVRRGQAPPDPRLAAAAVELAEASQRQGRGPLVAFWLPLGVAIALGAAAVLTAARGDLLLAGLLALGALLNIAHLAISPMARPRNVARSLRASRDLLGSSSQSRPSPARTSPD
jgi:hypothetical protein